MIIEIKFESYSVIQNIFLTSKLILLASILSGRLKCSVYCLTTHSEIFAKFFRDSESQKSLVSRPRWSNWRPVVSRLWRISWAKVKPNDPTFRYFGTRNEKCVSLTKPKGITKYQNLGLTYCDQIIGYYSKIKMVRWSVWNHTNTIKLLQMEGVDGKRKRNKIPSICSSIDRSVDEMIKVLTKMSKHCHDIWEIIVSHCNLKYWMNFMKVLVFTLLKFEFIRYFDNRITHTPLYRCCKNV